MQHDYVLKKMNFDLLTTRPESGGGNCRGREQNFCYYVAAFVSACNLINNVTMF